MVPGSGFGVWGLGFGVWGLGFGVWGLSDPSRHGLHTARVLASSFAPSLRPSDSSCPKKKSLLESINFTGVPRS